MSMSGDGKLPETGIMSLCANGGVAQSITDTELTLDFSNLTTGKGIQLDLDSLTTGTGLEIRVDSDNLSTGKALDIKAGSSMGTSSFSVGDTDVDGFVTIVSTADGSPSAEAALLIKNTNAGTTGTVLRLQHDSASPATNDVIGIIDVVGDNTPGTATQYARVDFKNVGVTTNVEECDIKFYQLVDGAITNTVDFNAEQNVTVKSSATSTGSNNPIMVLQNTSAGATGPVLRLQHDSASATANDMIGIIEVYGDNSSGTATGLSQIKFKVTDVTTDTEDCEIQFHNYVGGSLTETLTLDANGLKVKSGGYIAGAATSSNGIILKNLKNSAETNLTGTTQTVEVDLDGTAYYFTVYPSKDA